MSLSAQPEAPGCDGVTYSRRHPYPATLRVRRKLSLPGSEKETFHYELAIGGLLYEPGDSLAIFPSNSPDRVERLLALLGFSGEETVEGRDGAPVSILSALLHDFTIARLSKKLVLTLAKRVESARLRKACVGLEDLLWGRDLADLFTEFPELRSVALAPAELTALLPKLQPRLYSCASSLRVHPGCAHLLVTSVSHEFRGRMRRGVCTGFLKERADEATPIPAFVHSARHFHLPDDPGAPVIMVGMGCGVAPYRGFLQEREAVGARGRTWLFFGEQHARTDFHYEDEWAAWWATGVLTRMDTAFSRDQAQKIYVQHRILERAEDLWSWLQDGAYFYVCGDVDRMAPDVDAALHAVAREAGGLDEGKAREYVETLRNEKRYRRDVY